MQQATAINFAKLLDMVATAQPEMRIRFSTSNPQDMTLDVIDTMAKHSNICKYIHLPVQSGSNRILKEKIEVNHPISVGGWRIYQLSYDERMGRWSDLSVVELVSDPWLPVVYVGIFLLIAGGVALLFEVKKN